MSEGGTVTKLPGADRPKIDYSTGQDGRLAKPEYEKALDYLRDLDRQTKALGEDPNKAEMF